MLPTPPPPPQNDTGLESAVGKARLKEKYKSAWKFERYDVAFLDSCKPSFFISSMSFIPCRSPPAVERTHHASKVTVGSTTDFQLAGPPE